MIVYYEPFSKKLYLVLNHQHFSRAVNIWLWMLEKFIWVLALICSKVIRWPWHWIFAPSNIYASKRSKINQITLMSMPKISNVHWCIDSSCHLICLLILLCMQLYLISWFPGIHHCSLKEYSQTSFLDACNWLKSNCASC